MAFRNAPAVWIPSLLTASVLILAGTDAAIAQEKPDPVRRALAEKATFDFSETPLNEVLDFVKDKHKVVLFADKQSFESEGLDTATPVTFKIDGISLDSALHLMLDPLDLTFVPRFEGIMITMKSKAEELLERKVYGIRDLTAPPGTAVGDEDDSYAADKLIDLITATVAPISWQASGGRGSAKSIKGMLVVAQTYEIHREIEALLTQLRAIRKGKGVARAEDPRDRLLASKVTLEFNEVPLREVLQSLSERLKTPIVLNGRDFEDEGIDTATPVTVNLKDVTLRSGLALILGPLSAIVVKRHEVLVVTTPIAAEQWMERRIYDVRDLARRDAPQDADQKQDPVSDIIATTVAPNTWSSQGGKGVVKIVDGALVILQTAEQHQQIEDLLAELRKVRKEQVENR